jgi:hypothetical protein
VTARPYDDRLRNVYTPTKSVIICRICDEVASNEYPTLLRRFRTVAENNMWTSVEGS